MAGLYIHVPFCRQACRYCDFHFSVSLGQKERMLEAMDVEIKHKSLLFKEVKFETIYFGGGTPSVLEGDEVNRLIQSSKDHFNFSCDPHISFEANPDDLTTAYLDKLKAAGIERLSIGVQSLSDGDLKLMRRSHNATQAVRAIENAKNAGFEDVNADLIYGVPGMGIKEWEANLNSIFDLKVQHISAYHLTFETGTVFDHWRKKNRIALVDEEESLAQFQLLINSAKEEGYIHYEISNFALPGFFSKHNLLYWKNEKYAGIGPSAHSYDGKSRFWNISSNKKYMEMLLTGDDKYIEREDLSEKDRFNEYILTSLRTMWGADLRQLAAAFGNNYVKYTLETAEGFIRRDLLNSDGEKLKITSKGIFLADQIMREFIVI